MIPGAIALPTLLNKESQQQVISYLRSRVNIFDSFSLSALVFH